VRAHVAPPGEVGATISSLHPGATFSLELGSIPWGGLPQSCQCWQPLVALEGGQLS